MAENNVKTVDLPKIKEFLEGRVKSVVKKGVDFTQIIQKLRENRRKAGKKG